MSLQLGHVVVTGASSGIGEAIAREAISQGSRVTLVARRQAHLEEIARVAPERTFVTARDLGSPTFDDAWINEAEQRLGPIDVFINNAGVQIVRSVIETPWPDAQALLDLDLVTPLRLTQSMLARMIPRGAGTLVAIASMAALAPTPGMFVYNAAKAGLAAAYEGLRAEVRPHGIHVVVAYPGPVTTPLEAAGRAAYEPNQALNRAPTGDPHTLARAILRAVARGTPRVIYPKAYALARHFPNATRWALDALTPKLKTGRGARPSENETPTPKA